MLAIGLMLMALGVFLILTGLGFRFAINLEEDEEWED